MGEEEKKEEKKVKNVYGGSKVRKVDDEVRAVLAEAKALVIAHAKTKQKALKGDVFEAVSCRTQTVAGLNFFVKVKVGDGLFIHVFVWRKLDRTLELLKVEFGCSEEDELVFRRGNANEEKEEKEVNDMVRSACERVREAVIAKAKEEKVSVEVKEFVPLRVCSQVVAGTNLFVKVRVAEGKFVHVRLWCKLDSSVELSAVQWNKQLDDEIAYF